MEQTVIHFWDSEIWSWILLFAVLTGSLLVGNTMRRKIPFLRESLIPTSVIGGTVLLIFTSVYKLITGNIFFDSAMFGGNGTSNLEVITYHALALGFIASSMKSSDKPVDKRRVREIFDTGVSTVSTYLLQGSLGMGITILAVYFIMPDFFKAAGLILPFGYGQGTGQALNHSALFYLGFGDLSLQGAEAALDVVKLAVE